MRDTFLPADLSSIAGRGRRSGATPGAGEGRRGGRGQERSMAAPRDSSASPDKVAAG